MMLRIVFLLCSFISTSGLANEFKIPYDKYHLGKSAKVAFDSFGGRFLPHPTTCNSYPCKEFFKKSWNNGCLVREVYLGINPSSGQVVNVIEQFGGKCQARGDHPTVKTLVGEGQPKPKWLKNWFDGTANATWVTQDGHFSILALCNSIKDGKPFKKFKDCYVQKVYVTQGDANKDIRNDMKANNMEY